MDRAIPEYNKLLCSREYKINRQHHKHNLAISTKAIDNSLPTGYHFPINKRSKEARIAERCHEIEQQNHVLLTRMTKILSTSSQNVFNGPQQHGVRNLHPHSCKSLNRQPQTADNHSKRRFISQNSSNLQNRRNEIDKINKQNASMLKRLQESTSSYNVLDWEIDRVHQKRRLEQICTYKPCLTGSRQSRIRQRKGQGYERSVSPHQSSMMGQHQPNQQLYDLYHQSINENREGSPSTSPDLLNAQNSPLRNSKGELPPLKNIEPQMSHNQFLAVRDSYTAKANPNQHLNFQQPYNDYAGSPTKNKNVKKRFNFPQHHQSSGLKPLNQQATSAINAVYNPSATAASPNSNQILKTNSENEDDTAQLDNPLLAPVIPGQEGNIDLLSLSLKGENTKQIQEQLQSRKATNIVNLVAKKRPPPMNIGYNELGIEAKRKVLYRNFHHIGDIIYLVEISRTQTKVFILIFPNFEEPENYYSQVLQQKIACKLMNDAGNSFEHFVSNLHIKYNKLQILGYHHGVKERQARSVNPRSRYQAQRVDAIGSGSIFAASDQQDSIMHPQPQSQSIDRVQHSSPVPPTPPKEQVFNKRQPSDYDSVLKNKSSRQKQRKQSRHSSNNKSPNKSPSPSDFHANRSHMHSKFLTDDLNNDLQQASRTGSSALDVIQNKKRNSGTSQIPNQTEKTVTVKQSSHIGQLNVTGSIDSVSKISKI